MGATPQCRVLFVTCCSLTAGCVVDRLRDALPQPAATTSSATELDDEPAGQRLLGAQPSSGPSPESIPAEMVTISGRVQFELTASFVDQPFDRDGSQREWSNKAGDWLESVFRRVMEDAAEGSRTQAVLVLLCGPTSLFRRFWEGASLASWEGAPRSRDGSNLTFRGRCYKDDAEVSRHQVMRRLDLGNESTLWIAEYAVSCLSGSALATVEKFNNTMQWEAGLSADPEFHRSYAAIVSSAYASCDECTWAPVWPEVMKKGHGMVLPGLIPWITMALLTIVFIAGTNARDWLCKPDEEEGRPRSSTWTIEMGPRGGKA